MPPVSESERYQERAVYGPFYRYWSDTQNASSLTKQLTSGQIWGRTAKNGGASPTVKAYRKPPPSGRGIEFWSYRPPDLVGPRCDWRLPGPFLDLDDSSDTAKLEVLFARVIGPITIDG